MKLLKKIGKRIQFEKEYIPRENGYVLRAILPLYKFITINVQSFIKFERGEPSEKLAKQTLIKAIFLSLSPLKITNKLFMRLADRVITEMGLDE